TLYVTVTCCPWSDGLGLAETTVVTDACLPTTIVAIAPPLRPVPLPSMAACTLNVAEPTKPADGVKRRPAAPCATVMDAPSAIGVVPSAWNSAPLATLVILKEVTSAPSTAFGVMTRPDVVCTCATVVAPLTDGV